MILAIRYVVSGYTQWYIVYKYTEEYQWRCLSKGMRLTRWLRNTAP